MFFSDMDGDGVVEVSQGLGGQNELLQQEHYYPFGMGIKGEWKFVQPQIGGVNRYQYNGKELNEDFGLNWNDYGARWYDASIGRWNAVDPLAEDYMPWSGYNYVLGNPLKFIDPDGMAPEWIPRVGQDGTIQLRKEAGDNLGTLKQFLRGAKFSEQQIEEAYKNAKGGVIVELPEDNLSRAYSYAAENSNEFADPEEGDYWDKEDSYNCYHHCLNGAVGDEIYDGDMNMPGIDDAYNTLTEDFTPSSSNPLVYGKSVLAMYPKSATGEYKYQHVALYAGQDSKGNVYIHTKNGPRFKPQIQKLSDWLKTVPWEDPDEIQKVDNNGQNTVIDYYKPKQ